MPTWEGKSKANATGYKIFVYLLKTFGLSFAYFILRFVAAYYFLFSWESSRHIVYYFRNRLGFSKFRSLAALYRNYYVFGQTLIDKVAVIARISDTFTFELDGEHHLREMVSLGKGGLLLSAHLGSYEAAGHLLHGINTRISIVMYDGEDESVKDYMESVTSAKSFNIIFIKNDLSHIYKITEALSRNEIVCIHADRFRPGTKTLMHSFLGEEALFPEGPFVLALKLRVPVAFVYGFKETGTHYHFYSTELKYFYPAKGDTTRSILTDFLGSMEQMVKRYPYQWFNYYDFWKK